MHTTILSFVLAFMLSTVARATEFQVTVGGPGVLQYNPEYVVSRVGILSTKHRMLTLD